MGNSLLFSIPFAGCGYMVLEYTKWQSRDASREITKDSRMLSLHAVLLSAISYWEGA